MSQELGPYHLERKLFEDETGAWFAATDPRDGSACTLQVLADSPDEAWSRLRARVESARTVQRGSWLAVREASEVDGRRLVRYERLPGEPLAARSNVTWPALCRHLADACDALHALHSAGLLHGALTLPHVWITDDGAKLVGLAVEAPPCDAIGRRTELAAVASLAVEALTGHPAAATSSDSLEDATVVSASVQLADEGVSVPPRLQSILDALLLPTASSELATAADLAHALREVAGPELDDRTQAIPTAPADPLVGTTVAGYEILKVLGQGGMGVVYEAQDPRLDRKLALKRIRSEALGENGKERFLLEARACSRISHPNVVTVYASGEENGDPYLAMELLRGRTLKQMRNAGDVGWQKAVEWTRDILGALERLHAANIVHRDLKLDNIMFTTDGVVKLMDFGLATMNTEVTLTAAGSTVGTVWYMSPEQASGHKVDARSDVFSMGVVLYELLTGQRPFTGEHPLAVLLAIQQKDYVPAEDLDVELPAPIDPILRRALAKDPDNRYANAGQFRRDLEDYLQRATAPVAPARARRNVLAAGLAGGAAIVLVVLSVLLLRPTADRQQAIQHNELGVELQAQQKWGEARAEYRQAILADAGYALPYNNLGFLAWKDGNFAEADSLFHQALARDPDYAAAHFNLATSRWDQGDLEGAETSYRAAIAADPSFPGSYGNLGALLLQELRLDEAQSVLDEGLKVAPDDPQLLRHRGRVDLARGRTDEAIAHWQKALQADPDDFAVHQLLAETYEGLGDVAQALEHYQALADSPDAAQRTQARDARQRLTP